MTNRARDIARIRLREQTGPADVESVTRLVTATGFFTAAEVAIAGELVEEHLRKGLPSGYRFVFADDGSELAGYACFGPIPATLSSHDLYWIAVAPAWQGRGLGRLLLERVETLTREAGGVRLYAETSSRPAYAPTRAFYERTGFHQVAVFPEFYAPGDGKMVFEKRLV